MTIIDTEHTVGIDMKKLALLACLIAAPASAETIGQDAIVFHDLDITRIYYAALMSKSDELRESIVMRASSEKGETQDVSEGDHVTVKIRAPANQLACVSKPAWGSDCYWYPLNWLKP